MGNSFGGSEGRFCDGGRESGIWLVDVAEEVGKGGTGGRFRTGVEGVCRFELESRAGVDCVCVGEGGNCCLVIVG